MSSEIKINEENVRHHHQFLDHKQKTEGGRFIMLRALKKEC